MRNHDIEDDFEEYLRRAHVPPHHVLLWLVLSVMCWAAVAATAYGFYLLACAVMS